MSRQGEIYIITLIPDAEIDQVISDYASTSPQSITKKRLQDGTWSITVIYPPIGALLTSDE